MFLLKVLVFLCTVLGAVVGECPSGYLRHDESCYALILIKASWAEAAVYCQAVGAHLAYVETAAEQTFLEGLLGRSSSSLSTGYVWLGAIEYLVRGEWQWGFKGGKVGQTWWNPGSPEYISNNGERQACLTLTRSLGFKWNDEFCDLRHNFICETDAVESGSLVG
ncbi:perlucin-like [Haliotis rubra]|uniref:perlucin-like n=1 Tax=Haliotis rubra TaxID=36100 RepID=UPI001EE5C7C6|nr:perlucin-like [Haliotis rubra]